MYFGALELLIHRRHVAQNSMQSLQSPSFRNRATVYVIASEVTLLNNVSHSVS